MIAFKASATRSGDFAAKMVEDWGRALVMNDAISLHLGIQVMRLTEDLPYSSRRRKLALFVAAYCGFPPAQAQFKEAFMRLRTAIWQDEQGIPDLSKLKLGEGDDKGKFVPIKRRELASKYT